MSAMPIRCARCQQPLTAAEGTEEVTEEQGTSASLVYVHRGWICWAPYTRRHDGTVE